MAFHQHHRQLPDRRVALFLVVKAMNATRRPQPVAAAAPSNEEVLLTQIRVCWRADNPGRLPAANAGLYTWEMCSPVSPSTVRPRMTWDSSFPEYQGAAVSEIDALAREMARRRTFAIISHPDAGKTTLTEKLLLYAGAIELAGAVRGRKTQRHACPTGWRWSSSAASRSAPRRSSSSSTGTTSRCSTRPATRTSARTPANAARGRQRRHGARRGQGDRAADLKLFEVCRARDCRC